MIVQSFNYWFEMEIFRLQKRQLTANKMKTSNSSKMLEMKTIQTNHDRI